MWHMHAPTFNKWQKEKKKKSDTPHVDRWRNVRVWVDFLDGFINDKFRDIRKRNVTIRSEI
jgi:hypothetical protein